LCERQLQDAVVHARQRRWPRWGVWSPWHVEATDDGAYAT
jgi:hypothetical protein